MWNTHVRCWETKSRKKRTTWISDWRCTNRLYSRANAFLHMSNEPLATIHSDGWHGARNDTFWQIDAKFCHLSVSGSYRREDIQGTAAAAQNRRRSISAPRNRAKIGMVNLFCSLSGLVHSMSHPSTTTLATQQQQHQHWWPRQWRRFSNANTDGSMYQSCQQIVRGVSFGYCRRGWSSHTGWAHCSERAIIAENIGSINRKPDRSNPLARRSAHELYSKIHESTQPREWLGFQLSSGLRTHIPGYSFCLYFSLYTCSPELFVEACTRRSCNVRLDKFSDYLFTCTKGTHISTAQVRRRHDKLVR